jgi:hypothetical protein
LPKPAGADASINFGPGPHRPWVAAALVMDVHGGNTYLVVRRRDGPCARPVSPLRGTGTHADLMVVSYLAKYSTKGPA